jgi:oligoendopeptidase F
MNRRHFIQVAGLGAAATVAGRTAAAETSAEPPTVKKLPSRSEVPAADTWDLSNLYADDAAWEQAFTDWQKQFDGYAQFQGKLADGPKALAACIEFDLDLSRVGDRLGTYAHLKLCEDQSSDAYSGMWLRVIQAASRAGQASSFIRPEILAIPSDKLDSFLQSEELAPYRLMLTRIIRFKPHTLDKGEEKLLAMQAEMAESPTMIFQKLNDTELRFGAIKNAKGEMVELTHASFLTFLDSPDREVRANAFHGMFAQYKAHQNTFAATLNASIEKDIYYARARNFPSALEASMFPDNVPIAVYDNLIASIHRHFPALHRYYDLRRRKMGLKEIHFYDTYAPILSQHRVHHTFDEAIQVVIAAIRPLGDEYCATLEKGLNNRWCDRYENRGKKTGAFSSGTYRTNPYILMNFQPDVLDSVFTLAHEAGHSMHSYESGHTQPYAYWQYTIFVAEVASTFNETLLSEYLLKNARDNQERAFLLNRLLDSMRNTIFRQTMFAEFEKLAHHSCESGKPLTLGRFTEIYGGLLKQYFGPDFTLDPELSLECFRIPHFYNAFYVYKYATSMSAAITLADRVLRGGPKELNDYLTFLKGGCSKDPLELLRDAGVDMATPAPIDRALDKFAKVVDELDALI